MVTGANSGIGRATAEGLAKLGATVVMVCRNKGRGERAMADIKKKSRNDAVELLISEFASLDSVRGLATEFSERYDSLHVLADR